MGQVHLFLFLADTCKSKCLMVFYSSKQKIEILYINVIL